MMNLRSKIFVSAFVLGSLFSASHVNANRPTQLEKLLESPTRPTMTAIAAHSKQIEEVDYSASIAAVQAQPSDKKNHYINFNQWKVVMEAHTPSLIAAVEQAFPGARFAFLGRDTQALADVFEAFYLSLGQNDRVVRIGVSKASFVGATRDTLVSFLEAQGLSIDTIHEDRPFILIDTVSGGNGRQGRMLLDAIYTEYLRRGGRPSELVTKINMIGLVVSTHKGATYDISKNETILNSTRGALASGKRPTGGFGSAMFLASYVDTSNKALNEAGYEHFTGAWHRSYGRMLLDASGKVWATLGDPTDLDLRKSILVFQKDIYRFATTPSFLAQVEQQAKARGYAFDRNGAFKNTTAALQPLTIPRIPPSQGALDALIAFNDSAIDNQANYARLLAQVEKWANDLAPAEDEDGSQRNLRTLLGWYEKDLPQYAIDQFPSAFLSLLAEAKRQKSLFGPEIKKALEVLMPQLTLSTNTLEALRKLLKLSTPTSHLFSPRTMESDWMKNDIGRHNYELLVAGLHGFDAVLGSQCENVFSDK